MIFQTVYDASDPGNAGWQFPAVGLLFLAIGTLLVFRPDVLGDILPDRLPAQAQAIANWFMFIIALLVTIGFTAASCRDYWIILNDLNHGRYEVVEGPVTNFTPVGWGDRRGIGSFTVQGRHFSYSDGYLAPGFHNTAADGTDRLVHQGVNIRITHSGDKILRLEIAR